MRNLLFIFFTLITFANVSYASFPVADTLETKVDSLQTEEIKQYHQSLLKMGIELSACKCESCRKGVTPKISNGDTIEKQEMNAKSILIRILIIFVVLSIILVILLFRWADNFNKSGGIGVG